MRSSKIGLKLVNTSITSDVCNISLASVARIMLQRIANRMNSRLSSVEHASGLTKRKGGKNHAIGFCLRIGIYATTADASFLVNQREAHPLKAAV